jgi:hypothetical protein
MLPSCLKQFPQSSPYHNCNSTQGSLIILLMVFKHKTGIILHHYVAGDLQVTSTQAKKQRFPRSGYPDAKFNMMLFHIKVSN